jgi:hypothetical protein
MSDYKLGKEFYLKLDNGFVVCEQESTLEATNEGVIVRCKTTGDYGVRLEGGQKTGSISFSGAYVKSPTAPDVSAFDLLRALGEIQPAVWGGVENGDDIVEVDVQINSVSIETNTENEITFSATLDFAGDPVITTVGAS